MLVDETGRGARDAHRAAASPQNVGLNEAALAAAKRAKFRPATKDGVRVKMWYTLNIPFKL